MADPRRVTQVLRLWAKRPEHWLSSASFLRSAGLIVFLYGAVRLFGLERWACIVALTSPSGSAPGPVDVLLGCLFITSYGFFWLAFPPFLTAGVLMAVAESLSREGERGARE